MYYLFGSTQGKAFSFAIFVQLFFSFSVFGTTYTFIGSGSSEDASNWSGGIIAPHQNPFLGGGLMAGDSVIIDGTGECVFYVNYIPENVTLLIKSGNNFRPSGYLVVYGNMINYGQSVRYFTIYGSIVNYGTLEFWKTDLLSGVVRNYGDIILDNTGIHKVESCVLENYGSITARPNYGTFLPELNNHSGGNINIFSLEVTISKSITNSAGAIMSFNNTTAIYGDYGYLFNTGTLSFSGNVTFTGSGFSKNDGEIVMNSGNLLYSRTIENTNGTVSYSGNSDYTGGSVKFSGGSISVKAGGMLNLKHGFNNNSNFVNLGKISLFDFGGVTNDASLTNNGIIENNPSTLLTGSFQNNGSYSGYGVCTIVFSNSPTGTISGCVNFSKFTLGNSSLNINVNGNSGSCAHVDKITCTNSFSLSGVTSLTVNINYSPSDGDKIVFVAANEIINTFTNITIPLGWTLEYNMPTTGQIQVTYSSLLPLDLLSFTVSEKAKKVHLNWSTATETAIKKIAIERSIDGKTFFEIGHVKPKGSYSQYEFIDPLPYQATNYYRLKIIDTDGSFEYSKIRVITIYDQANAIVVFPTIFQNILNIFNPNDREATLHIFNLSGQKVFTLNSIQTQELNLDNLPKGILFVTILDEYGVILGRSKVFKM
jgi:hypothetical protein